ECLRDAQAKGVNPADCTLVVTLEPCNHHGKTPPCTAAIIAAGIKHVVVGVRDPNPQAAGGIETLQSHGITVEYDICAQACRDSIADFLIWQTRKRPFVILKMASTLDGRIATRSGQSRWVSSEASRAKVHALRGGVGASGGAVLIGGGTYRADNPQLTVRDGSTPARQPLACILTSRLPAPTADSYLVQQRPRETLFFASPAAAASPTSHALRDMGIRVWSVPPQSPTAKKNHTSGPSPDLELLLCRIREELHCPYVLCEGGGTLALSLLESGLVDVFLLHIAPVILGDNEARPLFTGRNPLNMAEALRLRIADTHMCGQDLHLTIRPDTSLPGT
ncbi:MAG: bifunctional diaminohydroxyphosphoribosylaminopyrimidine deaminase/5-amino-6-(5-phosphoribosylamino)uracil reductase RibD, partial [Desulfovibrionaceae bacterium]